MMTIESNLERIATALESLVEVLSLVPVSEDKVPAPAATPTVPPPTVPDPVPTPAPSAPTPPPAPSAPTPAPAAPTPPPATAAAPAVFADQKAFMDYCMAKYKALGPVKGGMIQQILIDLGASSIMGLPAEKWGEFRAKVEML